MIKISLDSYYFTGLFLSLAGFLVFYSCGNNEPVQKTGKDPETGDIKKPASSFDDSLLVEAPTAIFYYPDSIQLEKMRTVTDSAIHESYLHESYYMMRNARRTIAESMPGLRITDAKNIRYIVVRDSLNRQVIDLDTKGDAFGIILVKQGLAARSIDMANIASELPAYFSIH